MSITKFNKGSVFNVNSDQEWIYAKSKAKLNAIYGCSVMDPLQVSYHYEDDTELVEAIRHIFDEGQRQKERGENVRTVFCYCDTDSVPDLWRDLLDARAEVRYYNGRRRGLQTNQ